MTPTPTPDERKQEALRRVWREAQPITLDDAVYCYLRQRGLCLPDGLNALRYHPRLCYKHDNQRHTWHPAMLALVQGPNGAMRSIHRTYLTFDGHKASVPTPKRLMPTALPGATKGAAIRLYAPEDLLAVTEGIETALAVYLSAKIPTWSCISAAGLAAVVIPKGVNTVIIAADHDAPGLQAARTLARRLLTEGRRAKILVPDCVGKD